MLNRTRRQSLGGSTGRLFEKDCLETALKGISGGEESCIKRQIIPDCGCKVAEGLRFATLNIAALSVHHSVYAVIHILT